MSFIDSLIMYTLSQKVVAYGFIFCGFTLLASAFLVTLFSSGSNPLWQGFKFGALLFGLFILVGGIGYLNFSSKIHNQVESEYQSNPQTTLVSEGERMNKVVSDYTIYQAVFSFIVILSLATIVFSKPFWSGFAFPVAFLFIGVLLIEAHSKFSIDDHAKAINSIIEVSSHKQE